MRGLIVAIVVSALAGAATAATSPQTRVARVLLPAAEIGRGYHSIEFAGGTQVAGQVTLDLCGYAFASERLRVARHQVWYSATRVPVLSNEVVAYRDSGAVLALTEVRAAAAHCPTGWVRSNVAGSGLLRERLTMLHVKGLVRDSVGFIVHATEQRPNKPLLRADVVAVFQERRGVLSGMYGFGVAHESLTVRAALRSAQRLRAL